MAIAAKSLAGGATTRLLSYDPLRLVQDSGVGAAQTRLDRRPVYAYDSNMNLVDPPHRVNAFGASPDAA